MFYEQVLKSKAVVYGIPVRQTNGNLDYKFFSTHNWQQEYHSWLSLRSKNDVNNFGEALGISTDKGG